MRKFFIKQNNSKVIFSSNDQKHLKVLRMNVGSILECIDQNNKMFKVKITNTKPYEGVICEELQTSFQTNKPYDITCFLGIIRKSNFELAVEKLNELNIKKIIPVYFARSQKNIYLNFDRLDKIILESCKQSNRISKIILEKPIDFLTMCEMLNNYDENILAYENSKLLEWGNRSLKNKKTSFIIGPEGGFEKKEIEILKNLCSIIKLTNTILKSETASIFLASVLIERSK